jgi:hypothetical protein
VTRTNWKSTSPVAGVAVTVIAACAPVASRGTSRAAPTATPATTTREILIAHLRYVLCRRYDVDPVGSVAVWWGW